MTCPQPEAKKSTAPNAAPCLKYAALAAALRMSIHNLGDLFFRNRPDDLIRHLPALENQKRGDPANVVSPGGIDVLVHVQLHYFQLAGIVVGDLRHRGREHMARAAPIRPEVHHYRLGIAGVDHFGLKAVVRNAGDIFCHTFPFAARSPNGGRAALAAYLDDTAAVRILAFRATSY